MTDVDAFTQRMLDRARQRRENLDKKMAETTPRKRPGMPLTDNQEINLPRKNSKNSKDDESSASMGRETSHGVGKLTVHLSSPSCNRLTEDHELNHDSPNKKHCVRSEETEIKPDTPAIPSVRSRLHGLAALRNYEDDRMEVDPPAKPKRAPAPKFDNEYEPKPATRRNRLAALAQTINTWEDDLSRPVIKQEEKPKKIWQPPKAPNAPEPAHPSKPPRTYDYNRNASPTKTKTGDEATSDFMKRIAPTKFSPAKGVSPVKFSPSKGTASEGSPARAADARKSPVKAKFFPSPKPVVSTMTVTLANTPSPGKSVDQSTKPVASRLAAWQKKSTEETPEEPTKQPVSARKATWENKVQSTANNAFKQPKVNQAPKEPRRDLFDVSLHDPLNMSVHSRMGVWEKKVDDSAKEKAEHIKSQQILRQKSPQKSTAPRSTTEFKNSLINRANEMQSRNTDTVKAQSVSPMKSPGKIFALTRPKVGKSTKELHARLSKMDDNWKRNEIAEKIQQQKQADMAVLHNRWKNGVLNGEDYDESATITSGSNDVPVPPPPPPTAAPRKNSPKKSPTKTPKNGKREQARDKIRAEPGAVQSLGSLISSQGKNFEQKLCAMGFEVTPSKTATMDLTPIKQKEKAASQGSPVRPKPATVVMEETKVTTTRFGNEENVHVSTKTYPVGNHTPSRNMTVKSNNTPTAPSTPSIYNLIKKTPSNTPRPKMGNLHDSFDSDDSFDEFDRKQMPPPNKVHMPNTKVTVTTTVKRQDSMSSTQSETQSEYSEVTDTQDEYTEDYTEDDDSQCTDEDEEYSSEDESGTDNQQLDDLLDEAMDDTEMTETESEASIPVAPPRRSIKRENSTKQGRPISYHGSTSSKDSRTGSDSSTGRYDHILRHPGETPTERENRRKRGVTFAEGTTPATSEQSSAESEDDRPQVYSIDMYRSSWNNMKSQNKVTPKMTIVRHSEHSRRREEEEPLPYVPTKSVRQKLQELQELVNQEQIVIQQTSNALNQCCGTNSMFAGSAEAVECHRLLLIACKKREAYITEMQHLRDGGDSTLGRQPQGSLTLSDIRLPLKREFMSRIAGPNDTTQHYFICMIRNGAHVVLTQMMSTHDAMVRDSLDFPNLIQLKDIKQNFRFDLEIYGMSVTREVEVSKTPKKQKKGMTPKKWLKGSTPSRSLQSPAGPTSVRSTNFVLVACLPINIKSVTKTHFSLDKVPYSSPLQGTIHLKLRCLMESTIIEKGFLTIFEDVSGFGAWHRRWFVLKNHTLSFWKYPDDEKIKEPIGFIDLKYCISEKIGLIPRDICARPNTFEILTVRRQQKGERDTLTSWVSNTVSTTRNMLSADTKEDRLAWCDRMNEALANVRSWSPEALRPIKVQAVEDPTKPLGGNKYQHMTNI